jgi:hypothetical protein
VHTYMCIRILFSITNACSDNTPDNASALACALLLHTHQERHRNTYNEHSLNTKQVNVVTSIRSTDVAPTLEELTKFNSRRDKDTADQLSDSDDELAEVKLSIL